MIVLILTIALCAVSCRSSRRATATTREHRATEVRAERDEEEKIQEAELVEVEIRDTTTTIAGGDTTRTVRHGVMRAKRERDGRRLTETTEAERSETNEEEMTEEEETRQHGSREEGAGMVRYALGAATCLGLLLLGRIKHRTKNDRDE